MTIATIRLQRARLHYEPDIQVATAVSTVDHLTALYLTIRLADGRWGQSEVRSNIAFLTGIPEPAVPEAIAALAADLPWPAGSAAVRAAADRRGPAIARAALTGALADLEARAAGKTVAAWLGAAGPPALPTNNCLFWSDDQRFDRLGRRFVAEGFQEIKVRVGLGPLARDLDRVARLRALAGPAIRIAIDANGAWPAADAGRAIAALARFGLAYAEQPTPPGDWAAFRRAQDEGGVPVMADEALKTDADVDALCAIGPPALAHLKLVKQGGPFRVLAWAERLRGAGIGLMIGQMNEGSLATALALHTAAAVGAGFNELYGAYGLIDDPARGLAYHRGTVLVAAAPGTGITLDPSRLETLWEFTR